MEREDLIRYEAFKKVVKEGDFHVKGEAVLAIASLFNWYFGLGEELQKHLPKPAPKVVEPSMKDIDTTDGGTLTKVDPPKKDDK